MREKRMRPAGAGDTVIAGIRLMKRGGEPLSDEGTDECALKLGGGPYAAPFDRISEMLAGRTEGERFILELGEFFGKHEEDLVFSMPVSRLSRELRPAAEGYPEKRTALKQGDRVFVPTDRGELDALITAIDDGRVTFDANHPYAGLDIAAEICVVRIIRGV